MREIFYIPDAELRERYFAEVKGEIILQYFDGEDCSRFLLWVCGKYTGKYVCLSGTMVRLHCKVMECELLKKQYGKDTTTDAR